MEDWRHDTLIGLYTEFKAYRPDCFTVAESYPIDRGFFHVGEAGSTVIQVWNARRAIYELTGHDPAKPQP